MTFEDEVEVRRASVGTKVLAFGFAILAVLGSFWSVVWFIRSYVEQPRVNISPAVAYAAQENPPAPPAPAVSPPAAAAPPVVSAPPANPPSVIAATQMAAADVKLAAPTPPAPVAEAPLRGVPAAQSAPAAPASSSTGSISDRWAAIPPAPAPAAAAIPDVNAAPPPTTPSRITATRVPTTIVTIEPPADEVAESSVPAISGPAPLPRRKPTQLASIRRGEPPLPRPRPETSESQSIWQAVPSTDDRYQATQ